VTVITADEIKRSGAKTIQEAIQWATGIVMYDGVGNAFQQTIDLRGFNGQPVPNTSVFVDGQRMNEPDFNTVNFDLIPYETIDRIEILPGAAAVYGKNAMGGVINITKRGADKHQADGETLFGSSPERYTSMRAKIGKTRLLHELQSGDRVGLSRQIGCTNLTVFWQAGISPDRAHGCHRILYLCQGPASAGRDVAPQRSRD
jgi:outer membrane cobalamin receptor